MHQIVGDGNVFLKDVKQWLESVIIDNWVTELYHPFHLIFGCPMYNDTRHIYLQAYLDNNDNSKSSNLIG